MRNSILKIFIVFITLSALSFAAPLNNALLSEVENNFFGVDYPKDTDQKRIERIENVLYGTTQTGDLTVRLKKISIDTGTVVKPQIKQSAQTGEVPIPKTLQANNQPPAQKQEDYIAEDSSVNYPVVDKMEKKLFNKTYPKDNIYTRLDRLEKKVYNTTYGKEV